MRARLRDEVDLAALGGQEDVAGRSYAVRDASGDVTGIVYLVGTPRYDPGTNEIFVPDLDYDVGSKNLLVSGVEWVKHDEVRDFIRSQARWSVGDVMQTGRAQLEMGLNRDLAPGVRLAAEVGELRAAANLSCADTAKWRSAIECAGSASAAGSGRADGATHAGSFDVGYMGALPGMIVMAAADGNDLSRDNFKRQAESLKNFRQPLLLPGIAMNTGPNDHAPIDQAQLSKFNGKQWVLFGDVLGGSTNADLFVTTSSTQADGFSPEASAAAASQGDFRLLNAATSLALTESGLRARAAGLRS